MNPGILPVIAGIGMSFAGFAGLIAAFRQRSDWRPVEVHMIRGIVTSGFTVVIFSLAPIPLAEVFSPTDVLRVAAAVLTVFSIIVAVRQTRSGLRISPEQRMRGISFALVGIPQVVVLPLAISTGRLEFYELGLVIALLVPILTFSFVLEDLGKQSS